MKHSSYSRTRDNNKLQIMIYKRYYESYKKKITIINTFARLFYS